MNSRIFHIVFSLLVTTSLFAQVKIITRADSLLFIGLDNETQITSGKLPVSKLTLASNIDGSVKGSNGNYTIHCVSPNKYCLLKVLYKGRILAIKKMRIIRVSEPVVYVTGDTIVSGGAISKKHLITFDSLLVKTNVQYLRMNVVRFDFKKITNHSITDSLENYGYKFSSEIKIVLKKSVAGDIIIFENCRVTGPDDNGAERKSIRLIVTE